MPQIRLADKYHAWGFLFMSLDTTIYIVDDDAGVRESLKFMIESEGHRVEVFENARSMIDRCRRPVSGCLIVDLRLPGMSGLDMFDQLKEMGTDLPTIVITGHGNVNAAVRALKAGAIDFIEKPFSDQALLDRIDAALAIGADQRASAENLAHIQEKFEQLTPRERQVMSAVVEGKLNKQIANELGLSHKTIEVHRAHVMQKMAVGSLAELVRMAVSLESHSVI